MIAYARLALEVDPNIPLHQRDLSQHRQVTVQGEGLSWHDAQTACEIPSGAVILAWSTQFR